MMSLFGRVTSVFLVALAVAVNCQAESGGTLDKVTGKPCASCHKSKVSGAFIHDALAEKECTPCHKATGGDHQNDATIYAVKDKSAKLCSECHESQAGKTSVHPAIEAVECIGCHLPHSASNKNLLKTLAPDLCFTCHNRSLVDQKETSTVTGFREGTQNLHNVHAGKNAIPCLACHDQHASSQPHLLRPKGMNGKDAVTLTYTAAPKGGNCTVSCHDALGYERK